MGEKQSSNLDGDIASIFEKTKTLKEAFFSKNISKVISWRGWKHNLSVFCGGICPVQEQLGNSSPQNRQPNIWLFTVCEH